jgi:hypothetical protein
VKEKDDNINEKSKSLDNEIEKENKRKADSLIQKLSKKQRLKAVNKQNVKSNSIVSEILESLNI